MCRKWISLEEIIQIWITSSKDFKLQYICKVYCREEGQYLIQFDAIEKSVMGLKVGALENCNKWTYNIQSLLKMKRFIFWINLHTPIEKQYNEDWKIPIHLKNNGPLIKVPLIFWFLIIAIKFCFYYQLNTYWKQFWTFWTSSFTISKISVNVWHWIKYTSNWQLENFFD